MELYFWSIISSHLTIINFIRGLLTHMEIQEILQNRQNTNNIASNTNKVTSKNLREELPLGVAQYLPRSSELSVLHPSLSLRVMIYQHCTHSSTKMSVGTRWVLGHCDPLGTDEGMLSSKEVQGCRKNNWTLWLSRYFCPWGVWLMHNVGTECTVEGREEAKGQRKRLCLNFPCLALKYKCLFHNACTQKHNFSYNFSEFIK